MSAAVVPAALGMLALWMWGHLSFSFITFRGAEWHSALPDERADYIGRKEQRQGEESIVCHAGCLMYRLKSKWYNARALHSDRF